MFKSRFASSPPSFLTQHCPIIRYSPNVSPETKHVNWPLPWASHPKIIFLNWFSIFDHPCEQNHVFCCTRFISIWQGIDEPRRDRIWITDVSYISGSTYYRLLVSSPALARLTQGARGVFPTYIMMRWLLPHVWGGSVSSLSRWAIRQEMWMTYHSIITEWLRNDEQIVHEYPDQHSFLGRGMSLSIRIIMEIHSMIFFTAISSWWVRQPVCIWKDILMHDFCCHQS